MKQLDSGIILTTFCYNATKQLNKIIVIHITCNQQQEFCYYKRDIIQNKSWD